MKFLPFLFAFASLPSLASAQVYETQFDDADGWTLAGSWVACTFQVDATPSVPDGAYRSAPTSLNANNFPCDDLYNLSTATSPPIDISGTTDPVLRFWCNNNFQSCCENCFNERRAFSVGNGGSADNRLNVCMTDQPDCTSYGEWHEHAFPLNPGWGTIQFRFLVETPQILFSGHAGWFVDDVMVESSCAPPASYCATSLNSSGAGARISATGSTNVAANDLRLAVMNCPPFQPALFFMGPDQVQLPLGDGWRCVGGQILRFPAVGTGASGTPSFSIDNTSPPGDMIDAGETWNFQCWFRDPAGPGGTGNNLSDGLEVTFCP